MGLRYAARPTQNSRPDAHSTSALIVEHADALKPCRRIAFALADFHSARRRAEAPAPRRRRSTPPHDAEMAVPDNAPRSLLRYMQITTEDFR